MKLPRFFLLLLPAWALFCPMASAQEQPVLQIEGLRSESEIIRQQTGVTIGSNGVVVRYGTNTVLTANRITLNETSGDVLAEGEITLQNEDQLWMGDRLQYNFKTRQMQAEAFKTGSAPFYVSGLSLRADSTNRTYSSANAIVTTDDAAEPGYRIRAKSLKIVTGKYIEARRATLYLGGVPIMYYPYYRRSLERHPNYFVLTPGYRSLYGPYLMGSYHWSWSTNLDGALNLDYRQKRGVGFGPDFHYDLGRLGRGEFQYYFAHDEDPGTDLAGRPIREDRSRFSFSHQATLRTNLTAKVVVRDQSDAQMIRDFFESEYRENTQPRSFLEVNQLWSNFSLDLLAQAQVNDFFQTVERLPDLKLTAVRQQLGISPFYYEGENSAGYFRFQSASNPLTNYAAVRADSYHQLLLPQTFFGWLNVTPRVGGRLTHYGETEGFGSTLREQDRAVFNTGAEFSFKASRSWGGARSAFWDVNELRHIIQPSVNYVYVPSPNKLPRELPQFDGEIPSLRLLPVEFPDYNAIDSIDSQNVLRLSLRNKLQTKRKDGIDNLANWALYTDWRLKPRRGQGSFADIFSDLDLKPRSWLTFNSENRYDVDNGHWRLADHTATVQPNDVWSVRLGHRYLRSNDPAFSSELGNNLISSRIYYRFNENWGARLAHYFEARDGTLEEQYYTVYRDFRSWTAALTFRVRDNRLCEDDFTVAVTFSLKAFPRFKMGQDRDTPSLLLGS